MDIVEVRNEHNEEPNYHDTTNKAEELVYAEDKCRGQGKEVLDFFKENWQASYTASEVHSRVFGGIDGERGRIPLTSVRRAMSNLSAVTWKHKPLKPALQKTTTKRDGPYGEPEHAYRFIPKPEETDTGDLFIQD